METLMKATFSSHLEDIGSIFGTDTIFILGKGPSVDEVNPEVFASSLVIGINDAERIVPVDISIFHADWVRKSVEDNGFKSRLYICPPGFTPRRGDVVHAPLLLSSGNESDVMMQRLLTEEPSEDFAIEEVLFLSALRIARIIAGIRKKPQTIYMVGFDFTPGKGYSKAIDRDYAANTAEERALVISPQEFYFVNTLYLLRDSELLLQHVGSRKFSALSTEELNDQFLPKGPISEEHELGPRVVITAELTTNHFGQRHRLERMIRAARAAGADYVKLQKRNVETFYTQEQLDGKYVSPFGLTFRDYRNALELDEDDFGFVGKLCTELGIRWFASVLDEPSFHFMQQFKPEVIKLPSTISEHSDYLKHVAQNFTGSVVLSTGMTDGAYERYVLESFTQCKKLYLMQCNSAYPTPMHHCTVGVIRHYRDLSYQHPQLEPAYSSHDVGWFASTLAVAAGARMVEKHVKLGNTEWAHFDSVALDLTKGEFREYVDKIREAEIVVGVEEKKMNSSEHHKYRIKS